PSPPATKIASASLAALVQASANSSGLFVWMSSSLPETAASVGTVMAITESAVDVPACPLYNKTECLNVGTVNPPYHLSYLYNSTSRIAVNNMSTLKRNLLTIKTEQIT